MTRPVRIANCSGFYGDRLSAAREMVEGGPIDVLTGDYLAELTMLILAKAQRRDPAAGHATTFLAQMGEVLATCVQRGIKVVANAGGLHPAGLVGALHELAGRQGFELAIAHVEGDDLRATPDVVRPRVDDPVTANAYLGGWGITAALAAGADVVVTGRVTDAALVSGPAAWWHGWGNDDWDALAGAVVAGHVIECGPQATGGNFSFGAEVVDPAAPGFPIAEVAADGSAVITKHDDTGGLVSVDTVTAQLLYEVGSPAYLGPDVVAHFDTITLAVQGQDHVAISGTRGSPPPGTLKVAVTADGGHRNTMTIVLTGLDVASKAARTEAMLFATLGGRNRFDEVDVRLLRFDRPDAASNDQATAHLRITVMSHDRDLVDRDFPRAVVELALSGPAGFHTTTPPSRASAFGIYQPCEVDRGDVTHVVVAPNGRRQVVADPPTSSLTDVVDQVDVVDQRTVSPESSLAVSSVAEPTRGDRDGGDGGDVVAVPLGRICGARSGDKGGNANVGVWARSDAAHAWLRANLTVERVRDLLGPEVAGLRIERHDLPNLRAVNFVVHGLLGHGVASTTRPDAQAKGLGEYLRSRVVSLPTDVLADIPHDVPGRDR